MAVRAAGASEALVYRGTPHPWKVTDPEGRPVSGATVWGERAFDETATTTSADGTFTVEKRRSHGKLCAFKDALAGAVETDEWTDAALQLQPAFSLTVDVRDAASDELVRGVRVDGYAGMMNTGHGSRFSGALPEARFTEEAPGIHVAHHLVRGPVIYLPLKPRERVLRNEAGEAVHELDLSNQLPDATGRLRISPLAAVGTRRSRRFGARRCQPP